MIMIYALSIVSFDIMVLLFCFLFNAFPGKWYRWHTVELQFFLSMVSLFTGICGWCLSKKNEAMLIEKNSLFTASFQSISMVIYLVVFVASVYRFFGFRKTGTKLPNKYFRIDKKDYKIVNELNYTLGNLIFIPNTTAYAIFGASTIIFSGAHPSKEIDAGFICKKIGNNVYECISYIDFEKQDFIKRALKGLVNTLVIVVFLCVPILVAYTDYVFILEHNVDDLYSLYEFVVLFLLGSLGHNLFANTKGLGKILYWFFFIMRLFSIFYLFIFLDRR